jgi:hypothetical protein
MSTIQVQVQRFSVVSPKPFEIILEELDVQKVIPTWPRSQKRWLRPRATPSSKR